MSKEKHITTNAQLLEILNKISFENSTLNFKWKFKARPFTMNLHDELSEPDTRYAIESKRGWIVWAEFQRPDIRTGQMGIGRGRDEIIWRGTTESGVVKTAWVIFNMLIHHEQLEGFRYKGVQLFNPHNTVEELSLPAKMRQAQEQIDTYKLGGG